MSWGGLIRFLTGFVLAIAIIFFAGINATRYILTRLTAPPPRPTFPNDRPSLNASESPAATEGETETASDSQLSEAPSPEATPTASPTSSSGLYQARVTQSIGLVVRAEPSRDAAQVGGVAYEQEITVIGESPDGEWLQVRVAENGPEGWIKSGNTTRLD